MGGNFKWKGIIFNRIKSSGDAIVLMHLFMSEMLESLKGFHIVC
jgi:hypothetical protein